MTVDRRTRVDGTVTTTDPSDCFADVLPAAFAEHGDLLERAVRALDPPPLVLDAGAVQCTLSARDGRVVVTNGDAGGQLRLRVDATRLTDLLSDQVTVAGWCIRTFAALTCGFSEPKPSSG